MVWEEDEREKREEMAGETGGRDEECKVDSLLVFWAAHKRQGLLLFSSLLRGKRKEKAKKRDGKGEEKARRGKARRFVREIKTMGG